MWIERKSQWKQVKVAVAGRKHGARGQRQTITK
jgi:hypothetical protein